MIHETTETNNRRWVLLVLALAGAAFLLGAGLVGGFLIARATGALFPPAAAAANLPLIEEAQETIADNYVDQAAVTDEVLTYGAISGMVDALGDIGHSRFLSPEMLQAQHEYNAGEFEGIGAYVETRDGATVIVSPIDNSPAQAAGLQPGDVILAVDGEDVSTWTLTQVVQRVLGPAGTDVTLTVFTPETNVTRDVTLTRARIQLQNVTWAPLPGTNLAHVRIAAFSEDVGQDLQQALVDVQAAGHAGVVLDLRNNPGGLLREAISVASQFLPQGTAVLQRQDAQGNVKTETATSGGAGLDMPLVVLINEGSASGSEIVAGALQDDGRAPLVGETTFGTGTVLSEFDLSDGSALLLATEQWLTPDGRVIWHAGIEPDVAVALPAGARLLQPQSVRPLTAAELQNSEDAQLLQAVELLSGG